MEKPQTVEEHANHIIKLVSYGLGYGATRSRLIERVREHLEQHFQLKEGEQS